MALGSQLLAGELRAREWEERKEKFSCPQILLPNPESRLWVFRAFRGCSFLRQQNLAVMSRRSRNSPTLRRRNPFDVGEETDSQNARNCVLFRDEDHYRDIGAIRPLQCDRHRRRSSRTDPDYGETWECCIGRRSRLAGNPRDSPPCQHPRDERFDSCGIGRRSPRLQLGD